jgi:electron transfer flavoprotein alpha subunit
MQGIWLYSEETSIIKQLLTVGKELKMAMHQPIDVITLCADDASDFIAAGADKVYIIKGDSTWAESYADTIADLLAKEESRVFLTGGTMRGKDLAAKVAAKLQAGLVTDAQTIEFTDNTIKTTRLLYGGLAIATDAVSLPALVTVPPQTYSESVANGDTKGDIITIEVSVNKENITISNVCPIVKNGVNISTAKCVVCVGRGLAKQEDLVMVESLAESLDAEIGCTRSIAEDYHWLSNDRYIGISGQKIKPDLYLGLGVSGQVQHVVGIRDSKIIIAIDINEKAPIFEAADYGIVGDINEVVPLLTKALKTR